MRAVHVYLSPEAARALGAREGGNKSRALCKIVERYVEICRRSLPPLSEAEWQAVYDFCTIREVDAFEIRYLAAELEDALADGLAEKYNIDGKALAHQLREMSYSQLVAIVDAAERYRVQQSSAGPAPESAAAKDQT